jgi:hypothetical protein
MIAKKMTELAKAGERNVEVLCEAALNVPAGAVSGPNLPPLPALLPDKESAGSWSATQPGDACWRIAVIN